MALGDGFAVLPLRTEGLDKSLVEGSVEAVRVIVDKIAVDGKLSVRFEANWLAEFLGVSFVSVRGERHDRPFFEIFEPQMLGHRRVQHAEGIEDVVLRDTPDTIARADVGRLSGLVAVAVHHKNGGFLERRNKEGCGVRIVMAHLHDLRQPFLGAECHSNPHLKPFGIMTMSVD